MKQLFHIENNNAGNEQQILSLKLGERHGSFAVTDETGNELYELAYCSAEGWGNSSLTDFFSSYPCLQRSFHKVKIAYDYPQAVLIPSAVHLPGETASLLKAMFGGVGGKNIISELIPEWQLYNTYAVPTEVQKWLNNKFPSATYQHQYSLAIKNSGAIAANGSLIVDFRTEDFTLLAIKNNRLLLTHAFEYSTPEDVLYHLLKACQQFLLSQKEVSLQLSGLVDKQSSLYKELYLYFINVEFRETNWNTGNEYPAHFFTSLNDLARCAS